MKVWRADNLRLCHLHLHLTLQWAIGVKERAHWRETKSRYLVYQGWFGFLQNRLYKW